MPGKCLTRLRIKLYPHLAAIDLVLTALRIRFDNTVVPLLTVIDSLVCPNLMKVDMVGDLAKFYTNDIHLRNIA